MPVQTATCPICRSGLNPKGECVGCLLRVGLGAPCDPEETTDPRRLFGDFEIASREDGSLWELGRGAMGVTYRAMDTVLRRAVALKVIGMPDGMAQSPPVRERFLREARSAASLHHPNVAEVFQFGTSPETDQVYYAMELIDGETLEDRVRREGPLGVDATLEIAVQVAHALAAAADQGLVHRDVKPGNIMLSPPGARTTLRATVIDFGLAKAMSPAENGACSTHGGFVGTPAFASPEQFRGEPADARSDIYALGATLWFALTGGAPFTGKTIEELRDHPARAALPLGQLRARKVPRPLVNVLRSALAFDPVARPASAREVLTALESCRRPRAGRAMGMVLAVAALATAAAWWMPHRFPSTPAAVTSKSVAVLPFDNFSEEKDNAFFADGVQDEVLTDLAKVTDLKVVSRSSVAQYKDARQRNPREIGQALDVAYVVEGSVRRVGRKIRVTAQLIDAHTNVQKWAEKYDRDLQDVFTIQSDIAQAIADQLRSNLSPAEKSLLTAPATTDLQAYELYARARAIHVWDNPSGSQASQREKMALLEEAVRRDPGFALAYCELSKTYDDEKEETQNGHLLELARQAAEKACQLQPGLGDAHREMARYYLHADDFNRAHDEATIALRTLPNDAEAHRIVSEAYLCQDRWEQARPEMEKAHELDPGNYEIEYHLAQLRLSMRRYQEMERALVENRPASRMDANWVNLLRAESKLAMGDPAAAQGLLARVPLDFSPTQEFSLMRFGVALSLRDYDAATRVIAATSPQFAEGAYNGKSPQTWDDGMLARLRGDEEKAQAIFAVARQWTTTAWDAKTRGNVHLQLLSCCDAVLGHKDDAIREAREGCEKWPLAKNPGIAKWYLQNLALVYALTGERAKAIDELEDLSRMYDTINYGDLRCSPYWDALRGDPRFEALVASLAQRP